MTYINNYDQATLSIHRGHWYSYICMAYAIYFWWDTICAWERHIIYEHEKMYNNNNKYVFLMSNKDPTLILNTAIFIQKCLFPTWNDIAFTVFCYCYYLIIFVYAFVKPIVYMRLNNEIIITNLKRLSLSASYFYILICLSEILGPFPEIL
jgi:hypothetical protein